MADLHAVVVAEVERLERLYGGDQKDLRHAALRVVIEMHDMCNCGLHCGCNADLPCAEVQGIAAALGIEVPV